MERQATITYLDVDTRGRITLGKMARHRKYTAHRQNDGTIVLAPKAES